MTSKLLNKILWGCLMLSVAGFISGIYFGDRVLSGLANKTAVLRAESEANYQKAEIYTISREKVDDLESLSNIIQGVLPTETDQSVIVSEVVKFAHDNNVPISGITFDHVADSDRNKATDEAKSQPTPKGVNVTPLTLTLAKDARYSNILSFLEAAEKNRRKMQVSSINLTPSLTDGNVMDSATIKIDIYTKANGGSR